jgi:predicted nucleic acid-binding protein
MIILDTSVWIEFLRGVEAFVEHVRKLLETRNVLAIECVFAELLQGARDTRERDVILAYWKHLPRFERSGLWIAAGMRSGMDRLKDSGVGLIDVYLLTLASESASRLWTLDKKLQRIVPDELLYLPF